MRVWTRAPERAAPAEVAQAFNKSVVDGQTKAKQVHRDGGWGGGVTLLISGGKCNLKSSLYMRFRRLTRLSFFLSFQALPLARPCLSVGDILCPSLQLYGVHPLLPCSIVYVSIVLIDSDRSTRPTREKRRSKGGGGKHATSTLRCRTRQCSGTEPALRTICDGVHLSRFVVCFWGVSLMGFGRRLVFF